MMVVWRVGGKLDWSREGVWEDGKEIGRLCLHCVSSHGWKRTRKERKEWKVICETDG